MDNSEVLSDCSESSKISECFSSNLSILSGLSEYQGEFIKLRQLIDPETASNDVKTNTRKNHVITWYETQIKTLNVQLQNSLKENEKYKTDLYNLEKKKDILFNDKVEQLLKQNNQLERKLLDANNQIQRLFKIYNPKGNHTDLENKILQLEKSNQELSNQNYLLSNELRQCTYQKSEIESDYVNLKSEISDLNLELAAKLHCIDELKKKILDQHVELQNLSQNNVKLVHEVDLISTELEYARKSENWYKQELHQLQKEKSDLSAELLQHKKIGVLQEEKIQEMKLELSNLKCTYDEMRLNSLREKEKILRQVEIKNCDNFNSAQHYNNLDSGNNIERITSHYETVISDLTNDVCKIKSDFEHQQNIFKNLSKENSDLLAKYFSLQNDLKEKEKFIEQLENSKKDLKCKLSEAMDKQMEQSWKLLDLNKNYTRLETELKLKNQEKDVVESSIKTIKEQFSAFKTSYQRLKVELNRKNMEIMQLQEENRDNEIMNELKIVKLREEIGINQEEKENYLREVNVLKGTIENLQTKVVEENNNRANNLNCDSIVIDTLEYVWKICNKSEDGFNYCNNSILSENQSDYIKLISNGIVTRVQSILAENASNCQNVVELKRKIVRLKKNVISRIEKLEETCKIFSERNEENTKLLKMLCENNKDCSQSEKYKHLQALLQVKIQEEKDKQKRYERNYRTLLRKVREHMKGRNVAEKHNGYLQELHNNLSDECNTLKLQLELKDSEISRIQSCVDNYSSINEKLKQNVLKLEKELADPCNRCAELDNLKRENIELCDSLRNCEKCKMKEEVIANLQTENQGLLLEISSLSANYKNSIAKLDTFLDNNNELSAKLSNFETLLLEEKKSNERIKNELAIAENNHLNVKSEKEQLSHRLENIAERNDYLTKEIELINSCLQQKSEEINELHLQKKHFENTYLEKEVNLQKLITGLKNQILVYKNEIDSMKNEKFFLQRLCNDLKVALKVHVDHNKALKEYVNTSFKEKEKFDSLPILSNFPSPTRYDDGYINKLLEENKTPVQDTPLSDIQDCLNTLRNEIFVLQKQISDKNYL